MKRISWAKTSIALFVFIYYFSGIVFAIIPYFIGRNTLYSQQFSNKFLLATEHINDLSFGQQWNMYSPPPNNNLNIKYAAITTSGWGPLQDIFGDMAKRLQKAFILPPPGVTRPLSFLRAIFIIIQMRRERYEKFYYYQLSNYFCYGDGHIPGLIKIRFYIEKTSIPSFYDSGAIGDSGTSLRYERDCLDR